MENMQIAYIVARKNAKNRLFLAKFAKIVKKQAFFGKNRANSAFFDDFAGVFMWDSKNRRKSPDFPKSSSKSFEFYSNRGRVRSIAYRAIKQKTAYHVDGARS